MGIFERRKGTASVMDCTTSLLPVVVTLLTFTSQVWASEPRVVCYYTNWSVYRPGTAKFNPQNINPYLCTHLIYAFGGFTKDNTLKPFDKYQDIEKGGYAKFTGLKTYNKNLKTILAIGGWNEGSTRFSPMVASRDRRKEFVRNAIKFLRQNRFDGLDLDWEYPAFRDGGKPKDRENYAKLVKELREEFERESEKTGRPRLLLTMAVPAGIEYIQKGFDVKTLNQYLDWMNLLTYDYHSAFEPAVNHHAPLYSLEEPNEYSVDNELNIDYTIKYYIENGADRDKLVLGIPTYGRSYTLFNPDATEIGAPADGPGEQGDATREKGYLAYYEICESLKPKTRKTRETDDDEDEDSEEEDEDQPWTIVHPNPNAMGPVAYKGNQWVGYDDIEIVQKKAEYVAENGLGGIMFWSIDNDDFRGKCHEKPYPLIEAAKEAYINKLGTTDNVVVSEKTKAVTSSSSRRRNRPRSSTTSRPTTAARLQSSKHKSSPSSTTPSWSINTPEPPTTPDPGSDFKCVDEGFFPHPRDCKKYFWCLDSGPSNLGIVAHHFTCPSGLFFNKAADSCDFARNVLCKKPSATSTSKPSTTKAPTSTESSTTRRSIKLSTRSSLLFRTSTTTTTGAPIEDEEESEEELPEEIDTSDVDAEDPRVIKELIDLIKKVGGVEQLEKHLHLAESSMSTDSAGTTTPATFNKKLYQKVLERTRSKNKYSLGEQNTQNSRRGPQNAGLESIPEATSLRKDRPQYTTINRSRPSTSTTEEEVAELEERPQFFRARSEDSDQRIGTTTKPLQYVNIRRARPTTLSTSDTADDTASRNALFERNEPFVTVSESPSSYNLVNAKRDSVPEYVTIRRQRPTTEEATTVQFEHTEQEEPSESIEKETSSPSSSSSLPLYTSIVRSRPTTLVPPSEEPLNSPEPTTILAVQISSLLNSPVSTEASELPTEVDATPAQTTVVTEPSTTTTTTTTAAPRSSSSTPRRAVFKRRGSTTTTTTTTPVSTSSSSTQVSSERAYTFVRRRPPLARPNEITADSDNTADNRISRKIRSTTPDSREGIDNANTTVESGQAPRRYRLRYQQQITQSGDSVPAAATSVSRGQFRPHLNRDELDSLTPLDNVKPQFVPRENNRPRIERRFRPRSSTIVPDRVEDSEVSAATVEIRRPSLLPRGRNRFVVTSSTEASSRISEQRERRLSPARFTPRPFTRTLPEEDIQPEDENDNAEIIATPQAPVRLPFGRTRPIISDYTQSAIQGRKLPYPLNRLSTPSIDDESIEDSIEKENDDIDLSESTVEEKEHDDASDEENKDIPRKRIIIKKTRTLNASSTTVEDIKPTLPSNNENESELPIDAVTDEPGKVKKFKIIRRRPVSSTNAIPEGILGISQSTEQPSSTILPRVRKIIRKKIIKQDTESQKNEDTQIYIKSGTTEESVVNYGDKSKPLFVSTTTTTVASVIDESSQEPENQPEVKNEDDSLQEDRDTAIDSEDKPQVVISNDQDISISENNESSTSNPPVTEIQEINSESTTKSSTLDTSSTSRTRLPYRPPKRLFTSSTEPSVPSSSRTYSRKYSIRTYTSPATLDRTSESSRSTLAKRPLYTSRPFSRRPFTTTKTTPKQYEDEYESDEELEEEPETQLKFVPVNQLFTRKPNNEEADENDEETNIQENEESQEEGPQNNQQTSRKPYFRKTAINSNTFRISTSTTELPKQSGSSQNRTTNLSRFESRLNKNDTKKRVQNVPIGYNIPTSDTKPALNVSLVGTKDEIVDIDENSVTTIPNDSEITTEDDDYLTITESNEATSIDIANTYGDTPTTYTDDTFTTEMDSSDDYLEASDDTTLNPSTYFTSDDADIQTPTSSEEFSTSNEITATTESSVPETTTAVSQISVSPVVKTQFDKLFSVSRVVEVSSKLNKHRLSRNNESRLIESGEIMQEKKPTVDKIGEVSRFSLIKIVEDEIPIYLTRLGHVYPVENPPDNPIRIDEARNARALVNFADAGRENLIASESINKAYRHINKVPNKTDTVQEAKVSRRVGHLPNDDFLSFVNDDKSSEKKDGGENPSYWQFVPAAYENERSRQNKGAKNFEIITPRNILTDPSTLSLEGLFKTEMPILHTAKKINFNNNNEQPFVVYSSSLSDEKEMANFVKLQVLKSEGARSIKTYVKGQELNGGSSTEETSVKYPVYISVIPKQPENSGQKSTTTLTTKAIVELTTNYSSTTPLTTLITEGTPPETTLATTTETLPEETTTQKMSLVDALSENAKKRPKFAFPRRPNFKSANTTKSFIGSTSPRTIKKLNTTATPSLKSNKSSGFNPTKTRFSANRAQNVPIDLRFTKKTNTIKSKNNTTESPKPSVTTERKINFKSFRPNLRPAFVLRRTTAASPTTQTTKLFRRNFLRRTKATAPPTDATEPFENDLTTEYSTIVENTTNKYTRRGISKFKPKNSKAEGSVKARDEQEQRRRPSLAASAQKSEARKPARAVVRRRLGGVNGTTSTTQAPVVSSRRPYRVASRRRLVASTTTTSTAPPTTVTSEEYLQDIEDNDSIEDPSLRPRKVPVQNTSVKVQRRPLTSLKDSQAAQNLKDQNPSASTDDQSNRQSKKYSSSFKQNQLDEVIKEKSKSQEVTDESTERTLTSEDLSAETAIAIAAHQLLAAPLPSTVDFDFDSKPSTKKLPSTKSYGVTTDYSFTSEYTNSHPNTGGISSSKPLYSSTPVPSGYSSTPSYSSTSRSPPYSGLPRQSSPGFSTSGVLTNTIGYSGISQPQLGPSTARYLGTSDKFLSIPVEEFGFSTDGFTGGLGQEPVYFTREYLLESPVTKTYDDDYQYLSPVTIPQTTTRKTKRIVQKKISTTLRPTTGGYISPATTPKPRRVPQKKAFEKIPKVESKRTYRPIENYDYYDDSNEKLVTKYADGTKVVVHGKGTIECLDIGNFPHPTSCKKFISCARMENGGILGWEYICPKGLSFDPVGGICNWSAGLGCGEN